MKKLVAGIVVLCGVGAAAILAEQAVERDREYRRLIVQGDEAQHRGQTFVAIEAYSEAIALNRGAMLGYLKRGQAHQRRGDTPDTLAAALRDLRAAAALDPSSTRTLEQLGDVNTKLQRYANAVESYEAYIRLDDQAPTVFYKLALAARGAGRLTRAESALRQAIALHAAFHEAHYALGLCLKEREQLVDARASFERAVTLAPAFIPAREELAELHRLQERRRDEIDQLAALAALDPQRPERLVALGLAYFRSGNRERAVITLSQAAERFPRHPLVYTALGRVWLTAAEDYGDSTDVRKALEALEFVAAQSTATSEALGLYGRALLLVSRDVEAEQALGDAAQRFPTDPTALLPYAAVAQRLGHLHEARQALIRYSILVDQDRHEAQRAATIADLSLALNDAGAALAWYEKSASVAPENASILARLADAQWRSGQFDRARATLQHATEIDPADPSVRAAARRLQPRR
jgi:tetratricopeptide (TPR) repeat protein